MSSTIDERIVRMSFDNAGFQSGVSSTLSFLDKLNQGLKLKGATSGLDEVDRGVKSLTSGGIGGLAQGVDGLGSRFSAMSLVAITALTNITNSAMNAGKNMLKAFTIEPITSGFSEYETKMGSIQTILTNTASKGTKMSDVTAALDELNTYADKTIYNFAEMTRNIGTFTAAGVDLDTSVMAIKGIANLAAGSGSSAEQASTAMYQLSQALAAGKVGVQDWNSVVNAGMGGELFQKALLDTAKGMGKVVDKGKPFRETLQDGWLTADVLTKTLEKFAEDESLVKAATEVKTFTGLMDTMKESVQSGWATSWEHIIGDKDEAAKLFTSISNGFNNIIGPSADARNAMLKFWNDAGGRQDVIDGLGNIINSVGKGIGAISDAFKEVFPPMTGKQLVDISAGFKDLTEKFKMSDETASKIKSTFKGVFSVLNLGKNAIATVIKAFSPAVGVFGGVANIVLTVTGAIGGFISKLNEAATKSGFFDNISKSIKGAFNSIKEFTTGVGNAIAGLFDGLSNVNFGPVFDKLGSGFEALAGGVGVIFGGIAKAIGTFDFNKVLQVINTLLAGKAIKIIKDTVSGLSDTAEEVSGIVGKVTGILGGVEDALEAFQNNLNASILLKIAGAIALLAGSLVLLASIKPEKLESALTGITVLFMELIGAMAILLKLAAGQKFKGFMALQTFFITFSTAVLILSNAVKNLSDLDWQELAVGLSGVAGMMVLCIATAKLLSGSSKGLIKSATGLLILSGALNAMVIAVKELGKIKPEELGQGLFGIALLLTQLGIFTKLTKTSGMGVKSSVGLLILAGAVNALGAAVKTFGQMNVDQMIQGLAGIGGVLVSLVAFTKLTKGTGGLITTAIGLTFMSGAISILSIAVGQMGSMNWNMIAQGLSAMAGSLIIIGAAVALLPPNMVGTAVGIGAMATALIILGGALALLGSQSWTEVAVSLTSLAGALLIVGLAMAGMTSGLPGAAAMLVMSAALALFVPQLLLLSQLSLEQIGLGLLALAGAFGVLGLAGVILTPVVPVLFALAGAIALLSLSAMAAGLGISLFASGLALLATVGAAGGFALVEVFRQLINLLPQLGTKLGEALTNLATAIGQGMPQITVAIGQMITGIIQGFTQAIPQIATAATELITALLKVLGQAVPKLVKVGVDVVIKIAEGIASNMGRLTTAAVNIIVTFLNTISKNMSRIVNAGINLVISFINGMANGLSKNSGRLESAMRNLIQAIIKVGLSILKGAVGGFVSSGVQLISGLLKGAQSLAGQVISFVGSLPGKALAGIKGAVSQFTSMGSNLIKGLTNGIKNAASGVVSAARDVVQGAINGAKALLGIHSPSRVFMGIGKYTVMGFSKGLTTYRDMVVTPAKELAQRAVDATREPLGKIARALSMDIDADPSIRPVIDLSGVKKGIGDVNKLVTSVDDFALATNGTGLLAGSIGKVQNGVSNAEVVSAIKDLQDNMPQPSGDTYTIDGVTYDDGTNVSTAVKTLVHAAKIERRV